MFEEESGRPATGAGSEYGRAVRDEARRKKLGHAQRGYEHEAQPWTLTVDALTGKEPRTYRGTLCIAGQQ